MTIIREIYYIHLQRLNPLKRRQISPNRLKRALVLNFNLWGKKRDILAPVTAWASVPSRRWSLYLKSHERQARLLHPSPSVCIRARENKPFT